MEGTYILIGVDNNNAGSLSGPIAKKKFSNYDDAVEHARTVLSSNGSPNLQLVYVMKAVAVAQRVSPPVEVVPILRTASAA